MRLVKPTLDALAQLIEDLESETVLTGILADISALQDDVGKPCVTYNNAKIKYSRCINELDGEIGTSLTTN